MVIAKLNTIRNGQRMTKRKCFKCSVEKPLTSEHFDTAMDPDNSNKGFTWQCSQCLHKRGNIDFRIDAATEVED